MTIQRNINYPGLVRALIAEALTDNQVREVCFDYYREVYIELAPAMSTAECIRRLVQWCYQHRQIEDLLMHTESINPDVFSSYATDLAQIKKEDRYPRDFDDSPGRMLPPNILHPLPSAPCFVGRKRELDALQQFTNKPNSGVISLIGLGGAGKTAIAAQFLDMVQSSQENLPAGLFVWSFYVNQDCNAFLEAAFHYFSNGKFVRGGGSGVFYQLIELLSKTNNYLIILDGLERVQRPQSDNSGLFGDLTDPLLSQIITRLAAGLGRTKCVITSRFPLPRLESWIGKTYFPINIDQLDLEDALNLLKRQQIKGNDAVLLDLIEDYGAHALTLDHLAGYLREYHNGDPSFAKSLPHPQIESIEPQERRLARVLYAYDKALSEREHALLSRLCVFRFGITARRLHSVFANSDQPDITGPLKNLSIDEFNKLLKYLYRLHLVLLESDNSYTAHPAIRDYFYRGFTNQKLVHQAIRLHYSSLVGAPGTALPEDEEAINLLEELIFHTLQTGNYEDAVEIYGGRMGSYTHLAWDMGQYSRCIRILNQFQICPDLDGLAWCLRAVGDFNAAQSIIAPDDTWWLGMIGCLRGYLVEVSKLLSNSPQNPIRVVSECLTGQDKLGSFVKTPIWAGLPISPAECFLYANQLQEARKYVSETLKSIKHHAKKSAWRDEIARFDLIMAQIELESGDLNKCKELADKARSWILQSGSQEHLCLLHLTNAKLAIREENFETAATFIHEGLHITNECNLGIYSINLHIEKAIFCIAINDYPNAIESSLVALNGILKTTRKAAPHPNFDAKDLIVPGSAHPKCQFVWGITRARFLYGLSLFRTGATKQAIEQIEMTLNLQEKIKDPRASETEKLLLSMRGAD